MKTMKNVDATHTMIRNRHPEGSIGGFFAIAVITMNPMRIPTIISPVNMVYSNVWILKSLSRVFNEKCPRPAVNETCHPKCTRLRLPACISATGKHMYCFRKSESPFLVPGSFEFTNPQKLALVWRA